MAGIAVASVFLFGLAPALSASNSDGRMLEDGARTGTSRRTRRLTSVFLTAEFGLTLILLAGISSSVLRFVELRRTFTTLDPSSVLTAEVALSTERYETPDARTAFFQDVRTRLGASGRTTAAIVGALPGGGRGGTTERRVVIDERPAMPAELLPTVPTLTTGPGYFDALGVALLRGRPFSERDGAPGSDAAIVNDRLVEIPLCERGAARPEDPVRHGGDGRDRRAGVVADHRRRGADDAAAPRAQRARTARLSSRSRRPASRGDARRSRAGRSDLGGVAGS